jgi:hypothetical protein
VSTSRRRPGSRSGAGAGALFALFLVTAAGACAGEGGDRLADEEGPSAAEVASGWQGCYTLSAEEEGWRLPRAVALDSLPLQGRESFTARYEQVFRARSYREGESEARDTPFAYWRPVGADSAVLGHPGALAGVTLRIARDGDGVRGTALSFSDVISPDQEGGGRDSTRVRLDPVPCETLGSAGGGG